MVPADAHPCAFLWRVMPAAASVVQVGLASDGGWARLNSAVGRIVTTAILCQVENRSLVYIHRFLTVRLSVRQSSRRSLEP
jgi:hypothetical protein